jgi:predicted MPP superfamily phosphohydrolase
MTGMVPRNTLLGLCLAAVGVAAYAAVVERNAFTLRRVTAPVLPPDAAPLRVLHISDLHLAPWQKEKISWVRALADLHPDVVINTGDNLGHENALPALREALGAFSGIPGVFVNGSNDYFAPELKNPFRYFSGPSKTSHAAKLLDTPALLDFLGNDLGWVDLNNRAASLWLGDRRIDFMGVDDPHRKFDSLSLMSRALDEMQSNAFDEVGEDSSLVVSNDEPQLAAELTVGVTHAPYQRILNAFVGHGAELIFAGHTHGGQVCIPGYGALVTNCDIPREQVKGLSSWHHAGATATLNVSAGLGTSIYAPVRFACAPEVTLLTLEARA